MVDFQSRNTGRSSEEEPDESEQPDDTAEEEPPDEPPEPPAESEREDEIDDDFDPSELSYAVVTITAERSISQDTQGDVVVEALEADGGVVTTRDLIQPSYDGVQSTITRLSERDDVDAVVTIGGTGVEPDDVTIEALDPLFDKALAGFGELFRVLAHEEVGSAVVGTRATAGIIGDVPVFAVPGTMEGALLATDEIIVPEAGSLASDARGQSGSSES